MPSDGRCDTRSKPRLLEPFEHARPPCQVAASSQRRRPPTCRRSSGRPWSKSARVRAADAASAVCHSRGVVVMVAERSVEPGRRMPSTAPRRHVEPAALPVDGEVLPEVGELQRRADGIGPAVEPRIVVAEEPQHEPPHGIGRPAAVVVHLRPGGVARDRDVLAEGEQQRLEERNRQAARPDGVADSEEDPVGTTRPWPPRPRARRRLAGRPPRDGPDRRVQPLQPVVEEAQAFALGRSPPRRRSRRRSGRTRRRPPRAAGSRPARARRPPGSSRSATRPARGSGRRPRRARGPRSPDLLGHAGAPGWPRGPSRTAGPRGG